MHNCEISAKLMKSSGISNYLAPKIKLSPQKKDADFQNRHPLILF